LKETDDQFQQEKRERLIKRSKEQEERLRSEWEQGLLEEKKRSKIREKEAAAERERIIADYKTEQQRNEENEKAIRSKALAEHDVELEKRQKEIEAQLYIAEELISCLFHDSGIRKRRTYQSPNQDGYYIYSEKSDSQLACEQLKRIQLQRQNPSHSHVEVEANGAARSNISSRPTTSLAGEWATSIGTQPQLDHKILFPTHYDPSLPLQRTLSESLARESIDSLFELDSSRQRNTTFAHVPGLEVGLFSDDKPLKGTLLWDSSAIPGGSELYVTLVENGWKPVYVRGNGEVKF
jgi:hypothetical protein